MAGMLLVWCWPGSLPGLLSVGGAGSGLEEHLEAEIVCFVNVSAEVAQESIVLAAQQRVSHQLSCLESGWRKRLCVLTVAQWLLAV